MVLNALFGAVNAHMGTYIAALNHVDSFMVNIVSKLEAPAKNAVIDAFISLLHAHKAPVAPVEIVTPKVEG